MTKLPSWLLLSGLATLAIGGGLWLGLAGSETAPADAPLPPAPVANAGAANGSPAPLDPATRQALRNNPAVQNYQARLQFGADYQSFIKSAAELGEAERRQRAAALAKEIDRREAAGELALSEALLLQVGLAQAEGGDEEAQKARADALVARYQALSQAREARNKTPDARFTQYKSDEKRIVDEVLSLDSIPDGLSRDQYLRQRLQEAREQAYQ
ncbi:MULTISPECIES: hypothetical protein [unclassified Pseudomonas]|uniref:hypothetical protein n=1 Tax=unclassified Pseudomonas TaxID=196821 RepID=UPI00244991AA|nr:MULTISPECIES: hypothetical protein [unclassified Pseudomonas]MDG9923353.1 hypothetical protein [Pseudomonas sp. GD04045]MDH0037546.1 hypothetical protein [Pseudomonas sp. GD04019]